MDSKSIIEKRLSEHQRAIESLKSDAALTARIAEAVDAITECFRSGHKVFFCGNGGSAADAQHLAAEFSGKFYLDRDVLPAEALHCNTSYMTAVGNDYSFEAVYARLISGIAAAGDILVGISTSGNSANIVRAFEVCRKNGVMTIGMTGAGGGKMKDLSDILLDMPSTDTPRVQECHITVGHMICELVESSIFGEK